MTRQLKLEGTSMTATVDEKYYDHLNTITTWRSTRTGIKSRTVINNDSAIVNRKYPYLHRYILQLEGKLVERHHIFHEDGDPFNNTVANLILSDSNHRPAPKPKTKLQGYSYYPPNQPNGIYFDENINRWCSLYRYNANHKNNSFETFDTEDEAKMFYKMCQITHLPYRHDPIIQINQIRKPYKKWIRSDIPLNQRPLHNS